jgi:hypothetical protein
MTEEKKPRTPVEAWIKTTLDLTASAANAVSDLKDSKKQADSLLVLARTFDALSARCAREAVLTADAEKTADINPLVEITALNMASAMKTTARELEQGKGQPSCWEKTAKALADLVKLAKSMDEIISQIGVSGTVAIPNNPLVDENGKPMAEG